MYVFSMLCNIIVSFFLLYFIENSKKTDTNINDLI